MHSALIPGASSSTRWASPQLSQARTVSLEAIRPPLAIYVPAVEFGPHLEDPMTRLARLLCALAALLLGGCGYNRLQSSEEQVKAAWAEVVNQYQRRADLIPNLVNTVKGFAQQEQQVLIGVTEARAKATSIQATPELINDPAVFPAVRAGAARSYR